ncbi:MAG: XRE family transcriptional regulator [Oleiphilus sp.]|nr:MAG: XRE family transcriptional regulator [Oleiphilus sp.]
MENEEIEDRKVLGDALIKTIALMGIRQKDCESIIGVSARDMRDIELDGVEPDSATGELCTFLIRAYRALYSSLGGNQEQIKYWLNTPNKSFGRKAPLEHMRSAEGLIEVMQYLEGMKT